MTLLRLLIRALGAGRPVRRPPPSSRLARYRSSDPYGRTPRPRRRPAPRRGGVGFFGPLPYYSTTTRRGTSVSVGGCCLPIPLMFLTAVSLFTRRRVLRALRGAGRP